MREKPVSALEVRKFVSLLMCTFEARNRTLINERSRSILSRMSQLNGYCRSKIRQHNLCSLILIYTDRKGTCSSEGVKMVNKQAKICADYVLVWYHNTYSNFTLKVESGL